jgi:hypothetical protein
MRRYLTPILVVLLALAALVMSSGGPGGQSAQAATAVAVGVDADPSGNTATTLGTIDTCRSVALGQIFTVDLFVQGVSGGITGFDITIHSNPGALRTLPPPQGAFPDVDMLLAEVGYVVDFSDVPDVTDNDGFYAVRAADPGGAATAENGNGVLARVTFKAVANGKSALHLTVPNVSPILTGGDGNPIEPTDGPFGVFAGSLFGAQIYVGQSCPGTNNPPNADAKAVGATEDTPLVVTLTGSDPEGVCPLTFATLPGASNGTLGSMGIPTCTPTPNSASTTVTFVPAANVCAPQQGSFQYTISDGVQTSSAATVTVNITCVNDKPSAVNTAVSTIVNNPVTITVTATDIENDCPLTFSKGTTPGHGILGSFTNVTCTPDTPTAGTSTATADITYTPDTDYKGPDSFTFRAADPQPLVSDLGTVSIAVTPVSADDKTESTPEDTPKAITLSATDVENHCPLDFAIVSGPSNGGLGSITNVTCTPDTPTAGTSTATADVDYTPDLNYNGSDSFSYSASNGVDVPDTATVSITVTPVNDPPQADDKSAFTGAASPVTITLSGTDVDNDCPLSFSVVAFPGGGSLGAIGPVTCTPDTPSPGTSTSTADVEYTPDLAFSGIDTFTYKATDPSPTDSNIATVSITVGSADADDDGLLDMFEATNGCVDTDPDTDDDGLTDGQEVILLGTLCDDPDTDGDTSSDALEMTLTGSVTSATSTTLVDDDSSYPQPPASPNSFWATDQWDGFFVTITGGTGAGQMRQITGNTSDTLTVDPAWNSTPDGTSAYAIHKVRTLPLVACAADIVANNEDPDPQPADLNDDRSVNILDTFKLFPAWLATFGDPGYDTRLDLNADGQVNILDVFQLFPTWLDTCTP